MSGPRRHHPPRDELADGEAGHPLELGTIVEAAETDRSRHGGSDPRARPADPAGTQPKVDPESLLPARRDPAPQRHQRQALADAERVPEPAQALEATGARRVGRQPAPYAPRFQFIKGGLLALVAVAVLVGIAVAAAPARRAAPPWSAWRPQNNGIDPAEQIADHVAPEYRLDSGQEIVSVRGGPPALNGAPMALALNASGSTPAALPGNNVLYGLCGNGPGCSIAEGTPSVQRGLLLRREALELALYTFRYVSSVNQVVVTIPSPPAGAAKPTASATGTSQAANGGAGASRRATDAPGKPGKRTSGARGASNSAGARARVPATGPSTGASAPAARPSTGAGAPAARPSTTTAPTGPNRALLFRAQDVAGPLGRPLTATLSDRTPSVSTMAHSSGAQLVNQITGPALHDFTIVQVAQTGPVLLLGPPS